MSELIGINPMVSKGNAGPAGASTSPDALKGLERYRIETWGCQMNEHDSEQMAGVLESLGLSEARSARDADIVLLNTCSIREKAAHKVFTRLGQLKRYKAINPHMMIGVCGCVAQQEQAGIFARAPHVDLVMGPRMIASLESLIDEARRNRRAMGLFDSRDSLVPEVDPVRRVSRTRAYITIMEGCNKTCTFCIVPSTRGREVCRPPEAILREAGECAREGFPEIELLGQNVNAWRFRSEERTWDFAALLDAAAQVPGIRRVRFTTSHPLHFREPIMQVMASRNTIARYLHLPLQAGSDSVLEAMHRGYTAREYLQRVEGLRRLVPDVALSTDIIVGFPGETEADFLRTLEMVRRVEYDSMYSFVYSPRPGTPAADLADETGPVEKKERLRRLHEVQEGIQRRRNEQWVGREVEILVDGPADDKGPGKVRGRTSQNHTVTIDGDPSLVGRFVRVTITRAGVHGLTGKRSAPLTSEAPPDNDVVKAHV